jgi:Icc-related predicted phosphoesterase
MLLNKYCSKWLTVKRTGSAGVIMINFEKPFKSHSKWKKMEVYFKNNSNVKTKVSEIHCILIFHLPQHTQRQGGKTEQISML